eukprot:14268750-Alexandrium_andersonii.AAC.1
MNDYDIWSAAFQIIRTRGSSASQIAEVKAHATWDDVARGTITERDLLGNHHAQAAVLHGIEGFEGLET